MLTPNIKIVRCCDYIAPSSQKMAIGKGLNEIEDMRGEGKNGKGREVEEEGER